MSKINRGNDHTDPERDARAKATEQRLRREIGEVFEGIRATGDMRYLDFARMTGLGEGTAARIRNSQTHGNRTDNISLRSLCLAAETFNLDIELRFVPREE